mmetsp:Transcript_8962/g.23638  ORF Transcript_8962/g.23638 Transcript_8962/m.23638 type:complete len:177 (+) Transcript_8962:359-889(+)
MLDFLIKEVEATLWLTNAKAGAEALMCAPTGKGYVTSAITNPDVTCTNVAFCAAGTGIAALKALIEADGADGASLIGLGGAGRTAQLFYGCQSLDVMAYTDMFEAWEKRGVQVVPVLSRAPEFDGAKGYVQSLLASHLKAPAQTVIVLCGGKEMQIAVKEEATKLGIPESSVLTNF